jgi:hypothetical protein
LLKPQSFFTGPTVNVIAMSKTHADALTRLYRECDPTEPIKPDDGRYVDCSRARGDDLVTRYVRDLQRADPSHPDVKVFAGHRGCGKTSEMLRMKAMLEAGSPKYFVVFMEIAEALDTNDLDFPDLLVAVAAELLNSFREAALPGFKPVSSLFRSVWAGLKETLQSEVVLKEAGVDAGFASLALELRNRPSGRGKLREAVEKHASSLLAATNDLLEHAQTALRESRQTAGIVLLIDGLDKLIRRTLPDGSNSHDRLFLDRAEQMCNLKAHVVYTIPISLIYTPRFAQFTQTAGEFTMPLAMLRIRGNAQSEPSPKAPGMQALRDILDKRCRSARTKLADMFDDEQTIQYVCQMSGGNPTLLLILVRAAIGAVDTPPITRQAVEQAVRNYANSLRREIPDAFWPKLKNFVTPQNSIPKDDDHQTMLFLLHVLEYMNGSPWYEVNPVLRTLHELDPD